MKFVVLNNDISTTNIKSIDKHGELVFSEFTFYKKVNAQKNDIDFKMETYLIPSLKYHRYSPDEIISFSPSFMKYLVNEKLSYDFNNINKGVSISYENINKKANLENSLELILKDGKPFKKENQRSYAYYPKAFELPSKKYQNRFIEIIKNLINKFNEEPEKLEKAEENKESKISYYYKSDIYEKNYKLMNNILDFKWNLIFQQYKTEIYKLIIDELMIEILEGGEKAIPENQNFYDFIQGLQKYFDKNNDKKEDSFIIKINEDSELNEEFFDNWKKYLYLEGLLDFSYDIKDDNENKANKIININLKADKSITDIKHENYLNLKNINGFLGILLKIFNKENNEKQFKTPLIPYHRFNMKLLLPKSLIKYIDIKYHIVSKIDDKEKFDKEKKRNEFR